jgi:hypothetical protein
MEFLESERILFRSKAKHDDKHGHLVITTVKLTWEPDGMNPVHWPWSSVGDNKYKPSKALVKITLVPGSDMIFELLGSSLQDSQRTMNECKRCISEMMGKHHQARVQLAGEKHYAQQVGVSDALEHVRKKSRTEQRIIDATERSQSDAARANLLSSDKVLQQQYKELVRSGIITADEFWTARQGLPEDSDIQELSGVETLLSGAVLVNQRLTIDLAWKQHIFENYPYVLKAYEEKVPTEMKESEFWKRLLESESFHSERGSRTRNSLLTDDMFIRYDAQEAHRQRINPHKRIDGVDPRFDLTATTGDHKLYEYADDVVPERSDRAKCIVQKYKHASILAHRTQRNIGKGCQDNPLIDLELTELNTPSEPHYVELRVNKHASEERAVNGAHSPIDPDTLLRKDFLTSLHEAFPSSIVALSAVRIESINMNHITPAAREAALAAASGNDGRATKSGTSLVGEDNALPKNFVDRVRVVFNVVTELLRHHYALSKHFESQDVREKLKRIQGKLHERKDELTMRRDALPDDRSSKGKSKCINSILDQIRKADEHLELMQELHQSINSTLPQPAFPE